MTHWERETQGVGDFAISGTIWLPLPCFFVSVWAEAGGVGGRKPSINLWLNVFL